MKKFWMPFLRGRYVCERGRVGEEKGEGRRRGREEREEKERVCGEVGEE